MLKGLKRSVLAGESFLMNTFTAPDPDAHVAVAPVLPGDIVSRQLTGQTIYLQSGSYLASSQTIDLGAGQTYTVDSRVP
jgi:uncharacterized protein (AIM24 family)